MKKRCRFIQCIWRDKVDLMFWLALIFVYVYYHRIQGEDISKALVLVIFYFYYAMYRRETFWQRWQKLRRYMKNRCEGEQNPDTIILIKDKKHYL